MREITRPSLDPSVDQAPDPRTLVGARNAGDWAYRFRSALRQLDANVVGLATAQKALAAFLASRRDPK